MFWYGVYIISNLHIKLIGNFVLHNYNHIQNFQNYTIDSQLIIDEWNQY